jgi:hypothetical protein
VFITTNEDSEGRQNSEETHDLIEVLREFEQEVVVVDVQGCISTLKIFNDFDVWMEQGVVICNSGEDYCYIEENNINKWYIDEITNNVVIVIDNEIQVEIYRL